MRALSSELRKVLERGVLEGRRAAEVGVRAALGSLGVGSSLRPDHLDDNHARLRVGLRAKQRQLGGDFEVLVWECAYEQWHRLLFARFLIENGLLRDPEFGAPVTMEDCAELAGELGEPDGWAVAGRFAAEILPGIFRLDDPCVRVRLAPEHRLGLERVVAGLPAEVFAADDSLGWVYQYWQSERKDAVNASEVKIGGADLGPVTQLFTENYMVRFLLENSLGAWWAARHPDSPLVKGFDYLRFDEEGVPAAGTFDGWPDRVAEVTVMDPCCGSGHFLVEAFGMLWRMRAEEEGLDPVAAQDAVLADNLFGLELDPRCVQIAMFAVALTAWKQGGGWRELPVPNIACSGIPAKAPLEEWTALAEGDARLEAALQRLHTLFRDADTLGSLIDPKRTAERGNAAGPQRTMWDVDFAEVAPLLAKAAARETNDPATAVLGADAVGILAAARLLGRQYSCVATNVPFLVRRHHGDRLRLLIERGGFASTHDLATVMLERCVRLAGRTGLVAVVSPQNWIYLKSYEMLRTRMLRDWGPCLIARLGEGGFASAAAAGAFVSLSIIRGRSMGGAVRILNADEGKAAVEKAGALKSQAITTESASSLQNNPGSVIAAGLGSGAPRIGAVAQCLQGISTGDGPRFIRLFWEVRDIDAALGWAPLQSSAPATSAYSGRRQVVWWQGDRGELREWHDRTSARIRGTQAWGRWGVGVGQMRDMPATLYTGDLFDNNSAVVVPKQQEDLPALWLYMRSNDFVAQVRKLTPKISVEVATIEQVPFDVDRWRARARDELPEGLPAPRSEDPTQWLFDGNPVASAEPLQVVTAVLLGFRWPEQHEADALEAHIDRDGLVCLPAVGGERPGSDRLTMLLADAFSDDWSPSLVRSMLEAAGSKKKALADWLRDDFFKHHCKVFSNRPFVWHIWDGRKDGFAALVNYHKLDRTGLEKLTYTYLGQDWIERQAADAADGVTGADVRLAAAKELKRKLELILEGEPPYDIYVRWKDLHEQPIGWEPDLDDGVRLNIRPFVEAGVLRSRVNVHWKKDRGKNPDGSDRHNHLHFNRAEKLAARQRAGVE